MSEVKAPKRLRVPICYCGRVMDRASEDEYLHCDQHHYPAPIWVEYVPATDSPDREPDAPFAYWNEDLGFLGAAEAKEYTGPHVPLYRTPPDRSDGLREALENLTGAVQPLLAESRSFKHGEPLTLLKVPLLPDELTEARDALAAARLALKAESK